MYLYKVGTQSSFLINQVSLIPGMSLTIACTYVYYGQLPCSPSQNSPFHVCGHMGACCSLRVCIGYIHLHVCLYRDYSNTLFLMHVYSCTNAHINTHTRVLARILLNCA